MDLNMENALLPEKRIEAIPPVRAALRWRSFLKRVLCFTSLILLSLAGALGAQTLSVNPTSVTLSGTAGSTTPVNTTVTLSTSSGSVTYSASSNASWLLLGATTTSTPALSLSGTAPGSLVIFANPSGMATGTYTGLIAISGGGVSLQINVTFVVSTIGVSPSSVAFSYQQNSANFPNGVTLTVTASAVTQFNVTLPNTSTCTWLGVTPISGTTSSTSPQNLTVFLNNSVLIGLTPNTYACSVTITPANATATPFTLPVTLTVTTAPTIAANPTAITMNFQIGFTTPSQTVTLTSNAAAATNYTLAPQYNSTSTNWISLSKTSGTLTPPGNSDTFTVSYNTTAALAAGTYTGQINVAVNNAQVQSIPVTLVVSTSPLLNLSASTVNFTAELNGSNPASQTVNATVTSGSASFSVNSSTSSGGNWLSYLVGAATSAGTPITITAASSGLPVGTYKGTLSVFASTAANNPQNIAVTLTVSNDALITTNVSTTQPLIFALQTGNGSVLNQTITVSSSTGAGLNYSATFANTGASSCNNWVSLSSGATGTTTGSFTATANPSGIAASTSGPACAGTITIAATNAVTGASAPNSPYTIPVQFFVTPSVNPLLVVTPQSAPAFTAQAGVALSPTSQNCSVNGSPTCTLTLSNTSTTDPLTVSVNPTSDVNWLSAGITSGTISGGGTSTLTLSLAFVPGTAGSYSGSVSITASAQSGKVVADSPIIIPVTLQVIAGTPVVNPTSLAFTQTLGGTTPAAQALTVTSTGQAISFNAVATVQSSGSTATPNWLTVTPTSGQTGTSTATLTVTVNSANLTPSTTPYQGTITITAAGASPVSVPVTFTVSPGTIAAAPTNLAFTQVQGGAAPATQGINITGTPGVLNFTTSATTATGGNWLTVSPASGSTPGIVTVTANGGSLTPGTYNGTVTITSTGATGSPINIPVTLTINAAQTLSVSPSTLTFAAIVGQASPSSQTASVTSSGTGTSFTATATTTSGGTWLTVSPTSGVAPAQLTISVATQSLAAGSYTGTIALASPNVASPVNLTVNLTVSAIPTPVITAVQNAASYAIGGVSPGENIFIKGTGIGPATLTVAAPNTSGAYPTTLANTRVFFGSVAAPILYVSATATSVMVPYEVAGQPTTSMTVVYSGATSAAVTYNVVSAAPGIYTLNQSGSGPGAILNQNYSVNGASAPAAIGSVVAVYMTGEGATSPPSTDGQTAPINGTGLNKPTQMVTATIGGLPATVNYYGSAPGIIYGVMQVNLTIPPGLTTGAQPIVISVGGVPSATGVTVAVQAATSSAEPE
jgi:uncharacterized protein (TIGR03437 family)